MSCEKEYPVFGINDEVPDIIGQVILQGYKLLSPVIETEQTLLFHVTDYMLAGSDFSCFGGLFCVPR